MVRRVVTFSLVLALLGWFTGLGQALHLQSVHGAGAVSAHFCTEREGESHDKSPHRSEGCKMCRLLAMPVGAGFIAPPLPALHAPTLERPSTQGESSPFPAFLIEHGGHDPPAPSC